MKFSTLNSLGLQFQDFTDPHSPSCHQFKHKTISGVVRFENKFTNGISFQNFPGGNLPAQKVLASTVESQGLGRSSITVFLTKSKKLLGREYLRFLIDGFRPSVILIKNSIISSDVTSDTSRRMNSFWNIARELAVVLNSAFDAPENFLLLSSFEKCYGLQMRQASPPLISRKLFAWVIWQKSMATKWSQLLNPLEYLSVSFFITGVMNLLRLKNVIN